jgi:hypothetical protein
MNQVYSYSSDMLSNRINKKKRMQKKLEFLAIIGDKILRK